MKKVYFLTALLALRLSFSLSGQTSFVARIGDSNVDEVAWKVANATGGGYMIVGYRTTSGSLNRDGLIVQLNSSGQVVWNKTYGGPLDDEFYDILAEGNFYYCLGASRSFVNEPAHADNRNDVWLVKIDLGGNVIWSKKIGNAAPGSGPLIGNDIGRKLAPGPNGGVVCSVRINSGSTTDQNSGAVYIDAQGNIKWGFRYDGPSGGFSNELIGDIVRDGNQQNYVLSGWQNNDVVGGMLCRINNNGSVAGAWNTRSNLGGQFISQASCFYSAAGGGVIYSGDVHEIAAPAPNANPPIPADREAFFCVNSASTGAIQSTPALKRIDLGTTENLRCSVFPRKASTPGVIMAVNDFAVGSSTAYLVAYDQSNHAVAWRRQIKISGINNTHQLWSATTSGDQVLTVGFVQVSSTNRDILVAGILDNATLPGSCAPNVSLPDATYGTTVTSSGATATPLFGSGCLSCWADNFIPDVLVTNLCTLPTIACGSLGNSTAESAPLSVVDNIDVIACDDGDNCPKNLDIKFKKKTKESQIEITDARTGDFMYERTFNDEQKISRGFKVKDLNLPPGDYFWEILATFEDEQGIERKRGIINVRK